MKKIYVLKIMMAVMLTMLMTVGNVFAEKQWMQVTYSSNLSVGDTVIIAAAGYDKAMGEQRTNNRLAVDVTKSSDGGRLTSIGAAQIFIVYAGNTLGTFAFFDPQEGGYLYAASNSNNYLKTETTLDNEGKGDWQINFSADGAIESIVAVAEVRNNMRYNNSGSIKLFSCYASGQEPVTLYRYEEPAAVANPEFSLSGGTYYTSQITVGITCSTPNSSIRYTINGSDPKTNGILYTNSLLIDTTTTVKAVAYVGTDTSNVSQATYTFPVEVQNIAAFKAANTASNSTVYHIAGDVTFVFNSGGYTYVKDATAGLLVYGYTHNMTNSDYSEGDVISGGLYGTYDLFNGQAELKPTHDPSPSTGNTGTVQSTVVTMAELLANYDTYDAKLVTIENVTFPNGFPGNNTTTTITQGDNTMNLYNRFNLDTTLAAGTVTNVTGFVGKNNNNIQIYPRYNADLEIAPQPTLPSLTVTINGEQFSTLDTLEVNIEIQNFTLGTDGLLKLESPLLSTMQLSNPMYMNDQVLALFLAQTFSPLPAGTHTVTASLVDMTMAALTPAVSQTVTFTVTAPVAATPVFSPNAGAYSDSVDVTLTCATPGAEIRYTTDGTAPVATSTLYANPFTLHESATVKAKAFMNSVYWEDSPVAEAAYTIVHEPTLTVDPTSLVLSPSVQYTGTVNISSAALTAPITITCNNPHFILSDTIFPANVGNTSFTVFFDHQEPAFGNITVSSGNLSAQISLVGSAQLPAPVITPASGTTDTVIVVEMSNAISYAAIAYTINGPDPNEYSETYSPQHPIVLNTPGTYNFKAYAYAEGWVASEMVTATYTVEFEVVETPVISPNSGACYEAFNATITCATAGAVIRYTTDGSEPTVSSTEYTAPVAINSTTVLKAKAWKEGMDASLVATATYNFPTEVANIAEFKATASTAPSNTVYKITGDVTYVFRSGRYMFVEDATAALMIFDYNTPVITSTYTEGDVISGGLYGSYQLYSGMSQMVPKHNTAEATGTPVTVTPMTATIPTLVSQYNTYESRLVTINNVTFIGNYKFVNGTDTMVYYDRFNTIDDDPEAGAVGSITGFVSIYNGKVQLYPRGENDITIEVMEQVATPTFTPATGEFENSVEVSISCTTDDAIIYYTLDGTEPDASATEYTAPFTLTTTTTVKAVAVKEGMLNSEVATATYDVTTGIRDMQQNVSIYPNPTNGNVTIDLSGLNAKTVELFSVGGQLLYSVVPTENVMTLSLNEYAAGVYFVRIHSANAVTIQKIVKK